MRNQIPWLEAVARQSFPASCSLDRLPSSLLEFHFDPHDSAPLRFAPVQISSAVADGALRSGEPFPLLETIDGALREARRIHPTAMLAVWLEPTDVWPREPCWMLGEYLAERDLFLWIDLRGRGSSDALDWLRAIVENGLACSRTFVILDDSIGRETWGGLDGSGVWLLRMKPSSGSGMMEPC